VQGVTEWIPVSSKTQDTLVYLKLLNGDPSLVVPILLYLHIGTVLAALVYFRKEIRQIVAKAAEMPLGFSRHAQGKVGFLFTSMLFTGLVGVPLLLAEKKFFPFFDASVLFVLMGIGLLLTGVLLAKQSGSRLRNSSSANWKDGVLTGLLQGLSVLPGVSRSGTSTTALIWRGFGGEDSFRLSFLLSIPTVVAAELVFYIGGGVFALPVSQGLALSASSFVFGFLTLDVVLKLARRINMAFVAFALGLVVLVAGLLGAG